MATDNKKEQSRVDTNTKQAQAEHGMYGYTSAKVIVPADGPFANVRQSVTTTGNKKITK